MPTDPVPRQITFLAPGNGITTLYYYATNVTPLISALGHTTFRVDNGAPHGHLAVQEQTANQVTLKYTLSDDYIDHITDEPLLSAFTSGLAACELQESVAVYAVDGTLSEFSPFVTVLADCGVPEATNSATSMLMTTTATRPLQPGRVYRYQVNVVDVAGNSAQIPLVAGGGVSGELVNAVYIPTVVIHNLTQNQIAYPDTSVNIFGTVTDLDGYQSITVTATFGEVTKTATFTSPIEDRGFNLSWRGDELPLGIYGNAQGTLGNIVINIFDGMFRTQVIYQGHIQSSPFGNDFKNRL